MTLDYDHRCHTVEVEWDEIKRCLKVTCQFKHAGDAIANKKFFLPETQKLYFDPQRGYLDPGSLNIKKVILDAKHIP